MKILAQRAAHIIALSPAPVRDPEIDTLISLWQSTISAVQSVLHVLFLPTPFKSTPPQGTDAPEEVLKAGALYRKCAVVNLRIPSPATADAGDAQVPDDGELGGVHLGQAVWEGFEGALKEWEKMRLLGDEKARCDDIPSVDTPSNK